MANNCALVVDDDDAIRRLLVAILRRRGIDADAAGDGEQALARMKAKTYDVMVLDLMMPKMTGFEVLEKMEELGIKTSVIVLSAASLDRLGEVDSPLVMRVIRKPFEVEDLVSEVLRKCGSP